MRVVLIDNMSEEKLVCDCGYIIQNAADEQEHLKTIHAPDWTPSYRKGSHYQSKAEPETKKNSVAEKNQRK